MFTKKRFQSVWVNICEHGWAWHGNAWHDCPKFLHLSCKMRNDDGDCTWTSESQQPPYLLQPAPCLHMFAVCSGWAMLDDFLKSFDWFWMVLICSDSQWFLSPKLLSTFVKHLGFYCNILQHSPPMPTRRPCMSIHVHPYPWYYSLILVELPWYSLNFLHIRCISWLCYNYL